MRLAREDELLPEIPAFVYAGKTFTQYAGELPKAAATPKFKKAELKDYEIVDLRGGNGNNSVILSEAKDPVNSCAEILFDLKHVNVRLFALAIRMC